MTTIREVLDQGALDAALDEILANVTDPEIRASVTSLLHGQRSEFLGALDEVLDDLDQSFLLASRYIEQKARWTQFNLAIQYKTMLTGVFDYELMCKASAVSWLLSQIEPLIDEASLERINALLTQPLASQV